MLTHSHGRRHAVPASRLYPRRQRSPYSTRRRLPLQPDRNCLHFHSRVIWTIPHGLTRPTSPAAERHETALVFSKGKPIFNATPARVPQKQPGKRAFKVPNKGELSGNPLGAWPSNVWSDIGNLGHNHPERASTAAFPLALARRAVLLYSMPGDLVIDPFLGSGTTAEAALRAGRAFSGCDLFYH